MDSLNGANKMSTTTLIVIIVVLLVLGGGWGYSRRGRM
jgi:high-affinity Fe2+/Pb2+ permease